MNPRICLLCGGVGGARAALALAENLARRLSSEVQTSARQTMEMLAKSFGAQSVQVVFPDAEPRKTQLVDAAASAAS